MVARCHIAVFILLILDLRTAYGFGHETGNGGGAFLCHGDDGKAYVELVDLWEAVHVHKRKVAIYPPKFSARAILKAKVLKLHSLGKTGEEMAHFVRQVAAYFDRKIMKTLTEGELLPPPTDVNLYRMPEGCELVTVYSYFDADTLGQDRMLINGVYEDLMENETHRAAGLVHEAVYRYSRTVLGHQDSRYTREVTGCLFSYNCETLPTP